MIEGLLHMIKTVLFDLDGTLLPMDYEKFMKMYFKGLVKKASIRNYEPNKLIDSVWKGTYAMVKNDGSKLNEEVFWDVFKNIYGEEALKDKELFDSYYYNEFKECKECCGFEEKVKEIIDFLKSKGVQLILATNPLFPLHAQEERLSWTGASKEDFSYITSYSNSSFCKPNPSYFKEIINKFDLDPSTTLMVGNDLIEDTACLKEGIDIYIVGNSLLNLDKVDINKFKHGSYEDLLNYLKENI